MSFGNLVSGLSDVQDRNQPDYFGLNPNSRTYGSQVQATIARRDWERYKTNYRPIEDRLFSLISDPDARSEQMSEASGIADRAYAPAMESFERRARGLGLTLNEEQRASFGRQLDTSKALATVGAANRAGRGYDDLRRGVLGGSLYQRPGLGDVG